MTPVKITAAVSLVYDPLAHLFPRMEPREPLHLQAFADKVLQLLHYLQAHPFVFHLMLQCGAHSLHHIPTQEDFRLDRRSLGKASTSSGLFHEPRETLLGT